MEDPRVLNATRYGYIFHTDVIDVLRSGSFEMQVRHAALRIYEADAEAARNKKTEG